VDDNASESQVDSGEEEELELTVDEHGRVAGTSDCGLDFSFVAFKCPVLLDSSPARRAGDVTKDLLGALRRDSDALFGSEDSFWLPAGMQPRCVLERLAAEIFRYHTRNVREDFNFDGSGAEW
jgi:hypothetical protein